MKRKIYDKLLDWKNTEQTDIPYVLHTKDLKIQDGITYLPLYMTMLLQNFAMCFLFMKNGLGRSAVEYMRPAFSACY